MSGLIRLYAIRLYPAWDVSQRFVQHIHDPLCFSFVNLTNSADTAVLMLSNPNT